MFILINLCFIRTSKSQHFDVDNLITFPNFGDASSSGLGGIFTIINKGAEALNGNPAGLARSHTAQIIATTRLTILGTNDFDEAYYNSKDIQNFSSGLKLYPKLLNIICSAPIKISNTDIPFIGAIGYRSIYDISYKYNSNYNKNNIKLENTEEVQGYLNTLSLGIATKLKKKYYFGLSINFPFLNKYNYQNEERSISENLSTLDKEKTTWDLEGGTFMQLGFIGEISKKIMIGLNFMTDHSYKLRNGKWIKNSDGNIYSGNFTKITKYSIPSIYTLGISYKINPNLIFATEIQNAPWEDIEKNGISLTSVESGKCYRFGVEYSKNYTFRSGFQIQRLPLLDSNLDPVNLKSFTFGVNIPAGNFNFDIGSIYKFTTFDKKMDNQNWEYKIREWTIYTTIRYYFDYSLRF